MNPGSSQFASQFPDAEETMSKMESKKLRSRIVLGEVFTGPYEVTEPTHEIADRYERRDLQHDARIAHEQREVIWKLVEAIHDECAEYGGYLLPTLKALDAAAPYLED